jgi:hypothetical protein
VQHDCGRIDLFLSTLPQIPAEEKIAEGYAFRLSPFASEVRFSGPSFSERCLTYIDCCFARNGYSNEVWFAQLQSECNQRSQFFAGLHLAKKAGLLSCEPWEVLIPAVQ